MESSEVPVDLEGRTLDPVSRFLGIREEPLVNELGLSNRVVNALRANYHDWEPGHWEMEFPPVSWLKAMRCRARRKLHHIGPKALREIEAVCPSRDKGGDMAELTVRSDGEEVVFGIPGGLEVRMSLDEVEEFLEESEQAMDEATRYREHRLAEEVRNLAPQVFSKDGME
jgi:hypothetical protein